MTELVTAEEMRAIERAAIDGGSVTGLELMERAGRGVVEAVLAEWPRLSQGAQRAVVLCGPGNNGGDGFVIARLLKERGWDIAVFLHGEVDKLPPDARENCDRWGRLGKVSPYPGPAPAAGPRQASLVVDALFGTGLARPLDASLLAGLKATVAEEDARAEGTGPRLVAVDIPSGLDSDSGQPIGGCVAADLTVTFHRLKRGHVLGAGPRWCGKTVFADIGLGQGGASARLVEAPPLDGAFGIAKRAGHKYGYGHAVVLGGGAGKGGAARMSARGALRIGAGLVTLAVPPAALQENAAALTAIMLRSVRDADGLRDFLSDDRLNALCAGPGLGIGARQSSLVDALLEAGRPTVLDADALTLVAGDDALRGKLHQRVVLTPHAGEFARLFPDIAERLEDSPARGPAYSRADAARDAAHAAGCTLLLKGPDTVIADPGGDIAVSAAVYERAAPWLATAGSGDVLAGFITGLLARGLPPMRAATTASWLHVECARSFGPGLIAEDLPDELPKVFRNLGL